MSVGLVVPGEEPVTKTPRVFHLRRKQLINRVKTTLNKIRLRLYSAENLFTRVYSRNSWRDSESRSGPGSSLENTARVRAELPGLLRKLEARSLLDIPCGDLYWIKDLDLGVDRYIGADIVKELVERNEEKFGSTTRVFVHLDLRKDELPRVDVVLCRDCLIHLSNLDIIRVLENIKKSQAKYLLTTSFTRPTVNEDIVAGEWRQLNLQAPPLSLPAPMMVIKEGYTGTVNYPDKVLALWKISDLP
jgi:SAM-dependent methyltransferase